MEGLLSPGPTPSSLYDLANSSKIKAPGLKNHPTFYLLLHYSQRPDTVVLGKPSILFVSDFFKDFS